MDPQLHAGVTAKTGLQQRMVPKLMMVNALLILPINQLLARIEQELGENPALEIDEKLPPDPSGAPDGLQSLAAWTSDDDEFDPFAQIAAPISLAEHLMMTLQAQGLSPRDHAIGDRLIGYINGNGFLEVATVQVAQELNVEVDEVESVLSRIQRFEPVGVGARTVEECLLIQLKVLEQSALTRLAQRIVEAHLTDLAARRFEHVAKALQVRVADVKEAHEFVKTHCYPYPGERYRFDQDGGRLNPGEVARPDVIIRRTDEGFAVELCRQDGFALRVNTFYEDLRRQMRRVSSEYTERSREHVRDYVSRAKVFIEALQRRNWVFSNIVQTVIQSQWEFLERGVAQLRPLTKAMVAAELGISESTVSRALDAKFAQLPSGRVVSFDVFFDQSLPVKERIRELIAQEQRPFTDEEIARKLMLEGTKIARRTVTKYREELSIPSSTVRVSSAPPQAKAE